MLEGGEDPRFIARRMVILASEDVGNADPQALLVADAAARAVDRVGLPECALNLAQACVYLALAPKSNASYKALGAPAPRSARTAPRPRPTTCATPTTPAPGSSAGARATATRTTSPAASATSRCSRTGLEERRFYAPTDRGFEAELGRRLEALRKQLREKLTAAQLRQSARVFQGRLSKLEPGRADTPAGGLDWGSPAGFKGESGGTRRPRRSAVVELCATGRPAPATVYRWVDGADEKLRLGGMALRNGLLIHGPTHWAAAVRDRDGEIEVASERKPELAPKLAARAARPARAAETRRGDGGAAAGRAAGCRRRGCRSRTGG